VRRLIRFDLAQDIPVVDAVLQGPRDGARARLVFDTGAAVTQLDTGFAEELGYSARDATEVTSVLGPAGDQQYGYLVRVQALSVLGHRFVDLAVAVFDFDIFTRYQIDGLLGFDVIKSLRPEPAVPAGILTVWR
jgi:hypothetical protein